MKPKILLYDIETAPMIVTSWELYEPRLSHENIIQPTTLLTAAWKWLGEKKVHAIGIDPADPRNDLPVITKLHEVLSAADVLVAHNGDRFDQKKFNARAIFHKLGPIPPVISIDTLKVARKHFKFDSNRLDYLGQFLGVGRKVKHGGFDLWKQVMAGDEKALAQMIKYNVGDVPLLEQVYLQLRPYMTNHPNAALFTPIDTCPICGRGDSLQKWGFRYTRKVKRQRYHCTACGAFATGEMISKVSIS